MAMNAVQTGVGIVISAVDRASGPMGNIRRSFGNFRSEFKKRTEIKDPMMAGIFKGILGAGLKKSGSALRGITGDIYNQTEDIRVAMRQMQSAAGATAADLERLRASSAGPEVARTGRTANDAARALGRLAKETNNVADSEKFLIPSLNYATMAEMDAVEGAGQLTDILGMFNMGADEAGATTDKLAWAMKKFNVIGPEIFDLFRGAAAGASGANQSFDDTVLAIGMMKKVFPDATKAAMAANTALSQLAMERTQKELKRLGVSVKDDATGAIRGLGDIIVDVSEKTDKMTQSERASVLAKAFGARAAGGMTIIMDQLARGIETSTGETVKGADAMRLLQEEMNDSAGASKKMADALISSDQRLKAARSRFPALFADTSEAMRDLVRVPITRALNALADVLGTFSPGMKKAILGIATGLGTILSIIGGFTMATAIMKAFGISILGVLWSAVKIVAVFAILLPLLAGLAIGFYTLYRAAKKNVGGVADSWDELKRKVKLGWTAMIQIIGEGKLSRAMTRELHKTKNEGVLKFVEMIERARDRFKAFWRGILAGIDEGAARLGPRIEELKKKFGWLMDLFTGEGFKSPLAEWEEDGRKAGIKLSMLGDLAADALGKVGEWGQSVADTFASISTDDVGMFIDDVTSFIFDLQDAISGLGTALGWLGEILGFVGKVLQTVWGLFRGAGEGVTSAVEALINVGQGYSLEQIANAPYQREHRRFMAQQQTKLKEIWTGTPEENAREQRREDLARVRDLKQKQMNYKRWFETPDKEWTATKYSFERAPQAMREQHFQEYAALTAEIRKLGGRPIVVTLNGKKVGEGVEDAGASENARDLGSGGTVRTFGTRAPAPAAGR